MSYVYIRTKAPLNRAELELLFWERAEFAQLREDLTKFWKERIPEPANDLVIIKSVNDTMYEYARMAWELKDEVTDMLDLLRDDYFQKRLNSFAHQKPEKKYEEKSKVGKFFHKMGEAFWFVVDNFKIIVVSICIIIGLILFIINFFSN